MDHRDKLLQIVKEKGPLLPSQINRELRTNVLFASAMLAEMVDQKKIKLSYLKVGGSPLYYVEGQEYKLEQFADKLPFQNHNSFNLLKNYKVLRDRDQNPETRVSLRELKDFAIPLEVNADNYSDLFWKFYLVSDTEAREIISVYLDSKLQKKEEDNMEKKQTPERQSEVQSTITGVQPPTETDFSQPSKKHAPLKMASSEADVSVSYHPAVSFSTLIDTEQPISLENSTGSDEEAANVSDFPDDDPFFIKVRDFFEAKEIEITFFDVIRKGSEYDFVIKLPSNVGYLNYYCKAKSKAKINDADLSAVFVHAQMKKLPVLFLVTGDLTKKANELLSREFKNIFVKTI
jgi:hypothetical protein